MLLCKNCGAERLTSQLPATLPPSTKADIQHETTLAGEALEIMLLDGTFFETMNTFLERWVSLVRLKMYDVLALYNQLFYYCH